MNRRQLLKALGSVAVASVVPSLPAEGISYQVTFADGAWRTRPLNTVMATAIENVSLTSNQRTLEPGTYAVAYAS